MERLTRREKDDTRAYCPSNVICEGNCHVCEHMDRMMDKLADYEDAEEQGLLLRLPCKVFDTVYEIIPYCEICEEVLDNPYACENCNKGHYVSETLFDYEMIHMFGKTVFLTREEAEQALAEMQKG